MAGKHVAAIEAELGVRLMQRSTRSLVLTEAGRAYYARSKRIMDEYEDAKREAAEIQEVVRGVLRVAAPFTFGEMHLSASIASFVANYPEVVVDIILNDRYIDLLAEGVDVAIRIGRLRDSDLVARRLAPCRMLFCAAPSLLGRCGPLETIDELRRAPRLAFSDAVSGGDWTILDPTGREHGIDGPVRMHANNMRMLLAATLRGIGISYGPSFVFNEHIRSGALVALLPDHGTKDLAIHAVYPTSRHVPLKLRSFIDHLAKEFGSDAHWESPAAEL